MSEVDREPLVTAARANLTDAQSVRLGGVVIEMVAEKREEMADRDRREWEAYWRGESPSEPAAAPTRDIWRC